MLIDTGSSVDIITLECFKKLDYSKEDLEVTHTPWVGFGGQHIYPVGVKKLRVRVGEKDNSRTVDDNFLVVDVPMAYNVIIGHPTLSVLKAVVAPYLCSCSSSWRMEGSESYLEIRGWLGNVTMLA